MRTLVVTLALIVSAVSSAWAQSPIQVQFGTSAPLRELGAQIGAWSLMGGDTFWGVRYGRRAADWVVAEWSVDKSTKENAYREHLMAMSALRFQTPSTLDRRRVFMTAGIAAASGLSYSWSPVVGVGGQYEAPDGLGAVRLEVQIFTRAQKSGRFDRGRILMGLTLGLPQPD
jgi:hypothetical protein